jgi:hypothetical protein
LELGLAAVVLMQVAATAEVLQHCLPSSDLVEAVHECHHRKDWLVSATTPIVDS